MKKIIFLIIIVVLSACAPQPPSPEVGEGPGVRETSTPPPTQTPIPTPTFHPAFVEVQSRLTDLGFTLQADGIVWDSQTGEAMPHLQVTPEGEVTIRLADGSVVSVDPEDMSVDEKGGLTVKGYELDENGEWVEAVDTIMLGKVTLTLSEPDENGVQVATKIEVKGKYGDEEKIDELKKVDPKYWGFNTGEVEIVVVDDQVILTPTGEYETEIARWFFGTNDWIWHWDQLEKFPGGNPVFEFGKLWEMNGVNEVDREGAKADDKLIYEFTKTDPTMRGFGVWRHAIYLYSADGQAVIGAILQTRHDDADGSINPEVAASGKVDGNIYFIRKNGELVRMMVDNLSFRIRYWRYLD